MKAGPPKRVVDGILLLDKPAANGQCSQNFSSNKILQKIKHMFQAKKAGHTGTIDPFASGMLPICFGEATKFSQFLLDSDKTYQVKMCLGIRTNTSDIEGEVIRKCSVPSLTLAEVDAAFDTFRGSITQLPSMYSALKFKGQPLYKLARQGIVVDRPSRVINVRRLEVISFEINQIEFEIECSKGTYVRTLVDDFGEQLGCGAHVASLRRLSVGPFREQEMVTIKQLEQSQGDFSQLDRYLLPVSMIVSQFPEVRLSDRLSTYVRHGRSVVLPEVSYFRWVKIITAQGLFLGVGEIVDSRCLVPRRLVRS